MIFVLFGSTGVTSPRFRSIRWSRGSFNGPKAARLKRAWYVCMMFLLSFFAKSFSRAPSPTSSLNWFSLTVALRATLKVRIRMHLLSKNGIDWGLTKRALSKIQRDFVLLMSSHDAVSSCVVDTKELHSMYASFARSDSLFPKLVLKSFRSREWTVRNCFCRARKKKSYFGNPPRDMLETMKVFETLHSRWQFPPSLTLLSKLRRVLSPVHDASSSPFLASTSLQFHFWNH